MPTFTRKVRHLSVLDQVLCPGRSRGDVGIAPYADGGEGKNTGSLVRASGERFYFLKTAVH